MTTARRAKFLLAALAFTAFGCRGEEPTLVLTTNPPDAEVAVDGYVHPGATPHEIRFKAPGRYNLSVRRSGYRAVEMLVTLGRGERREQTVELAPESPMIAIDPPPVEPPLVEPPPVQPPEPFVSSRSFTLRVTSVPAGAEVALRDPGSPVVRRVGATPVAVDLPAFGATEVTIEKAGYASHKRLVVPPASGAEVLLDVVLTTEHGRLAQPIFGDQGTSLAIDGPVAPAYGYLSVSTSPWSAVYVDGAPVGNTPISSLRVSTGTHGVVMENRDLGVRRKKEITVRAGEQVRLVEQLN
jgi:hypothetical protein